MKNFLYFLLMLIGIFVLINVFLLPVIETKIIYFPVIKVELYPNSLGLKYDNVFLKSKDGFKINGWFIKNKTSKKVFLILHGNGGNMSYCLGLVKAIYTLPASVLIIDYHGYGKSGGLPSENNFYMDAQKAYDYLINDKKYRPEQIILMGVSLGGSVATDLAVKNRIGALILQSPFTSAKDVAKTINPLYRWPIVFIRSDFNNLKKIQNIEAPLLVLHSKDDEMIPYKMSIAIYERANTPKSIYLFEGYRHDDFILSDKYMNIIRSFIKPLGSNT